MIVLEKDFCLFLGGKLRKKDIEHKNNYSFKYIILTKINV